MIRAVTGIVLISLMSFPAYAVDGMINIKSSHSVVVTTNRLVKALRKKGMTVFNRVDHAAAASKVGKTLRPTELAIFGNPKVGTLLMQCGQSMGIDLPLKALIWKDEGNQVWFSYNDLKYLANRHALQGCKKVLGKIAGALNNFAQKATGQ